MNLDHDNLMQQVFIGSMLLHITPPQEEVIPNFRTPPRIALFQSVGQK